MTATRPRYHVTAPQNWLNDPNGPVFWQGRYHLFFQHNPEAPRWGRPLWGHVSSPDLVRWTPHPPALVPDAQGPDRDGCWSGCTRIIDGVPTIYYTGVVGHTDADRVESVCRATSTGTLVEWRKDPANPVIPGPPAGREIGFHRDPFLVRSRDGWLLLLGSSVDTPSGPGGAVLHYRSDDLGDWAYRGVLFQRPPGGPGIDTGPLWECPQLVRLGGTDVLVVSVQDPQQARPLRYPVAFPGALSRDGFTAEAPAKVDHGDVFYAPATLESGDGRVLMWGWLQELSDIADAPSAHAGALSLPRTIDLDEHGLVVRPADEVTGLRRGSLWEGRVTAGTAWAPQPIGPPTTQLELDCRVRVRGGPAVLELRSGDRPQLAITVEEAGSTLHVRRPAEAGADTEIARLDDVATDGRGLALRLFVDADVVELFIEERHALATRLPRGDLATQIAFAASRPAAALEGCLHALG